MTQTQADMHELAQTDRARCGFCQQVFAIEDLTDIMLCRPCGGDEEDE